MLLNIVLSLVLLLTIQCSQGTSEVYGRSTREQYKFSREGLPLVKHERTTGREKEASTEYGSSKMQEDAEMKDFGDFALQMDDRTMPVSNAEDEDGDFIAMSQGRRRYCRYHCRCSGWKNAYKKQKKAKQYYYRLYLSYYRNYQKYYRLYRSYSRYYSNYYHKNKVCKRKYNRLRNGYMKTLSSYRNILKTCRYRG
jgi:hypothetical protein